MKQTEKAIRQIIKKWRDKLFLHSWSITLKLSDKKTDGEIASCHPDFKYHSAVITVHPEFFKEHKDSWDRYIIHELFHIVLAGVQTEAEARWSSFDEYNIRLEQTVEHLTRIVGDLETTSRSPDEVS